MIYLTRRFVFSAAHRLHSAALDAAGNDRAFGMCTNLHGHNYRLEVTVAGEPDAQTGFFCNVMDLAGTVQRLVVDPCEHRLLNEVTMFQGATLTMETIAGRIWRELERPLAEGGMRLTEVLLAETDDHWVRIRKDSQS